MRVLLLSPFAPNVGHDHAAADTLAQLVPRLAERTELFVYCPDHDRSAPVEHNYTLLPSTVSRRSRRRDRLGWQPAWLRQAWPRRATREAVELVRWIKPDVVHAEYLQCAEIVGMCRNSVLGLHDITERVMSASYRESSGVERAYRLAELWRTRRFERSVIRRAAAVLTLSESDRATVAAANPHTLLARPGVDLGEVVWSPPVDVHPPRLVFAGALWRRANSLVAHYLVREVMPLVWRESPTAELRIVGAGPSTDVVALAERDSRVTVTGAVTSLRAEMVRAHAVVVPSILGGGVPMKVLHAMALGCPVITSPGPAQAVSGDETMLFIGSTAAELATAVGVVLSAPDTAVRCGRRAREHIGRTFRWDDTVATCLRAYEIADRR